MTALPDLFSPPGGLMTSAAKRFGYVPCGFTISTDPDARGRAIRVWRKA